MMRMQQGHHFTRKSKVKNMKVIQTFRISFKALGDRKVRTSLTILMVIVGSSLMVTLNGIVAGLGQFATDVFSRLAPNILFVTSIPTDDRSEEHTSELQSPCNLVCRLLLEKKK